jgi:hypothetical protein
MIEKIYLVTFDISIILWIIILTGTDFSGLNISRKFIVIHSCDANLMIQIQSNFLYQLEMKGNRRTSHSGRFY